MTSRPAAAQYQCDLARLDRVRDRIDREYAQPLDVEALAHAARATAGIPSCVAKQVTRPIRNREAPITEPHRA